MRETTTAPPVETRESDVLHETRLSSICGSGGTLTLLQRPHTLVCVERDHGLCLPRHTGVQIPRRSLFPIFTSTYIYIGGGYRKGFSVRGFFLILFKTNGFTEVRRKQRERRQVCGALRRARRCFVCVFWCILCFRRAGEHGRRCAPHRVTRFHGVSERALVG